MKPAYVVVDGNEAAARVAHSLSEVIAIYPITPASAMGELADAWSQRDEPNIWGTIPEVIEMQSEGGAAGAMHGSLQTGALTTTFTASQGLLLMLPNMYKIAGELTPAVIHVAARTIATHALSIFGDHSDVMGARQTGFALLASASVQEAQDMALIAHAVTLETRIPFLHFFDGFRTSHEVMKIEAIGPEIMRQMIGGGLIAAHRERALNPNRPVLRGTAQNPDVFFQAREAANPFYDAVAPAVQASFDRLAGLTGRQYGLFEYHGADDAERVVVLMGSGTGAAREAVDTLNARGEKVGMVTVHLYRPFSVPHFMAALPASTTSVAVLDRTKEPGAVGEPLYQDVVAALREGGRNEIGVIGGRYGLSGKEFTPPMVMRVLAEAANAEPKQHFTIGITDDVSRLSLPVEESWHEPEDVVRAVFYGLGADGTVGANKNSVKIIGTHTDRFAQGHFVYDSKKSGAMTVSHLRFSPRPITSTYLIENANFIACHQFGFLEKIDMLELADEGATFLLNSHYSPDDVWDHLPASVQETIIAKNLEFYVVDGHRVAREADLGGRINTVLQTCFFALSEIVPRDEAIAAIKESIRSAYGKRGETVLQRNFKAVDASLDALAKVTVPAAASSTITLAPPVPEQAPDFVQRVTGMIIGGKGDLLPVSALPVDGTFPTDTAQWEKRSIADEIPIWDPDICIDCGRCALVCPHAAIRMKVYDPGQLDGAPAAFQTKEWSGKDYPGKNMTIQVAPEDCTGCGVCVDVCPAHSKEVVKHKAINMASQLEHVETERDNFDFFLDLPELDRTDVKVATIKGSQLLEPLFEFSGACSGCGETPYVKLLSQMYGDRILVANATGCSSIYGANLPTTPWAQDAAGRGPAWSNSLFEDNAEFGLGMRLALDGHARTARTLLNELGGTVGDLAGEILEADQTDESGVRKQRERIDELTALLETVDDPRARELATVAEYLVDMGVWIVGGDGWAYDIGFGGLDHVLALGRNVNILVLDTEVYSNTGGQASKSTPRAAVAKFAAGGKATGKKDLGMIAQGYGNVYVAQIAMGANMNQVVKAFSEAEAHPGTSLIIAYSPCIAHGIDMGTMMSHQKKAAESGYWPLYRYDPAADAAGKPGLRLDSREPTIPFKEFAAEEGRFAMLARANPEHADELAQQAQDDIDNRWQLYKQMVDVHRTAIFEDLEEGE
ncbi:MAG: pyruvate:ferredoxin (flavodoxin) oxidoreductase [Acidimicrobiia bacterium]|nr:pyruvate:ferredoxin (flavodoxin) oxidoreductase [Acidimicrobiia bacterium]MBT8191819.1 pyruvate:ferredoxin (flavodoxin) oxidoreductase [Acidimicrobiia bacterium]NNF89139.1 pyruvate:ferredoxin (flavodoxin) oxidoreductase [Acidimicrobiia bacterium]NNL14940.1 pyruvate:ferredoxin (flavodoxin) oxidoreductase [Acidimicrobiia bacterium]NNL97627.1 pyruvate:ferredoxin (flavodoxin) oxidoreductase [Acidimicrobiia bacterium]